MSSEVEKRTSDEWNYDERTTEENSDGIFQQTAIAESGNLNSVSDKTLQDLPYEMVESILIRAVAMEVKEMKLAKSVWKEKADLVISRLKTVCSQWNNILSTNFFRKQLNRILENSAPGTIHLETLHQCQTQFRVHGIAALKDEVFLGLFCKYPNGRRYDHSYIINVCDRNNMELGVKDVIWLPGIPYPWGMTACSTSDCLYLVVEEVGRNYVFTVLRITKHKEHQINLSTWITDLHLTVPLLTVSANGNLAVASRYYHTTDTSPPWVNVYNADGCLQKRIVLSGDILDGLRHLDSIMHRPNGNIVLGYTIVCPNETYHGKLTEIDMEGNILRQYRSRLYEETSSSFADLYGRIWIIDWRSKIKVVDSEFNLLDFAGPQSRERWSDLRSSCHFNVDRNEFVHMTYSSDNTKMTLTFFRFTEK